MHQKIRITQLHKVSDWKEDTTAPAQWVIDPERRDLADFLRTHGYYMIDRTIKATIPLKKSIDFTRFCRIPLEEMEEATERVYEIAEKSFLLDSRFISEASDKAEEIQRQIHLFVQSMGSFHVCRCKGEVAGFLELVADEASPEMQAVIRLAAVDEKYRVAGAALSLYAGVATLCKARGFQRLFGRISSRNVAVMNLYVALGASFSLPQDVYVRG